MVKAWAVKGRLGWQGYRADGWLDGADPKEASESREAGGWVVV